MQGVRGSNPLSSTRHNASPASPLSAICQRFARKRGPWSVVARTLCALSGSAGPQGLGWRGEHDSSPGASRGPRRALCGPDDPGARRLPPEHDGGLPGRGRPGQDLAEHHAAEDEEPHGTATGHPAHPRPTSPYRTLEIRGDVEITPDEDYTFARRTGQKYVGTDFGSADRPGESRVGVVLRPVRVNVTKSGRRRASSRRRPRSWSATAWGGRGLHPSGKPTRRTFGQPGP
jgi:hypothetical protein